MYRIKPADNRRVINPETELPLPTTGILVDTVSPYWRRRAREQPPSISVEEVAAPPPPPATAAARKEG